MYVRLVILVDGELLLISTDGLRKTGFDGWVGGCETERDMAGDRQHPGQTIHCSPIR